GRVGTSATALVDQVVVVRRGPQQRPVGGDRVAPRVAQERAELPALAGDLCGGHGSMLVQPTVQHKRMFLTDHVVMLYSRRMLDVQRLRVFRPVVASVSVAGAA